MGKVRYLAQHYTSTGNTYYYRTQLLTGDGNPYWSKPRPIVESTYKHAQRDGYECEWVTIRKPLADVIQFAELVRYKRLKQEWENGIGEHM